jgi:hypothetical protein
MITFKGTILKVAKEKYKAKDGSPAISRKINVISEDGDYIEFGYNNVDASEIDFNEIEDYVNIPVELEARIGADRYRYNSPLVILTNVKRLDD